MHKNLLVVDWDYFFLNPLEAGLTGGIELYDWSHAESRMHIEVLWPTRAAGFLRNGLRLPRVKPLWKTFPDRFKLSDDAVVYFADSNGHAGNLLDTDGDPFSDVWLYDAHHDSGYRVRSFAEWLARHSGEGGTQFSCEDWMLIHYMQGSTLHWRIPTWHEAFRRRLEAGTCDPGCDHPGQAHGAFWPEGVELDAKVDDLQPLEQEFDAVFICRSGAWVPPWEDRKFMRFVELWPGDLEQLDNENLIRDFNVEQAKAEAEQIREAMAGLNLL